MNVKVCRAAFCILLLSFSLPIGSGFAQTSSQTDEQSQPGMMNHDPLAMLNRMLESAGAPPLDQNQQQALLNQINAYKSAHQRNDDQPQMTGKSELEAAILSGNEAAVGPAADQIANQIAARTRTTINDLAIFEMQALKIFTQQQVSALRTQYGNTGLLHIIGSLAGGFGWHKGGGRGFGFGPHGQ
jgi:hypothetical protein